MFVTSDEARGGLLVAIITGGRPRLADRVTRKFLPSLTAAGVRDVVWAVSEQDAEAYERDEHEMAVYPTEWAHEYARENWTNALADPVRGGFLGAFPGREWACLEAERRGCWGVLQLDDNIDAIGVLHAAYAWGIDTARAHGGMGLVVDLLSAVALATNSWMTGARLNSVGIPANVRALARTGFPYSAFIEKVGPDREHWKGPFEDDIMHAFQYGTRADGATAAVVPLLAYNKEYASASGMRKAYDPTRAVALQRMFPQSAHLTVKKSKSNGQGGPRVFHHMNSDAIRNPLRVTDRDLYLRAAGRGAALITEASGLRDATIRAKVERRSVMPPSPAQQVAGTSTAC